MDIYAVNTENNINEFFYNKFLSLIDNEKRIKILRFIHSEDVLRSLIGDITIRSTICNKLHIKNKEIKYKFNEYGKPEFINNKIHFNISHSGKWVVCIIDYMPIGIDIEKKAPLDYSEISKKFFSDAEYKYILHKNNCLEEFYNIWVLKESYIKMKGKSIGLPLDSFSVVSWDKSDIRFTEGYNKYLNCYFYRYNIDKDYSLAVCACHNCIPNLIEKSYQELYEQIY